MQKVGSPGLRRRIIWSIASLFVVVVLGLGVFNAVALPGCAGCHEGAAFRKATAASPHAKVDCRSCHVPPGGLQRAAFGLGQTFHMFVRPYQYSDGKERGYDAGYAQWIAPRIASTSAWIATDARRADDVQAREA